MAGRQRARKSANILVTPHLSAEAFVGKEDQWFIDKLMSHELVKAAAGQREECPTTNAEHMQLFVILTKKKREGGNTLGNHCCSNS